MRILIAGDLVINQHYNAEENICSPLKLFFENSDFNIVNLEAPVTKNSSKILKTGPSLKSDIEKTKNVLKILQIDAVTLANNHILDYDGRGIKDTLKFCRDIDIKTVGAGMNLREATETLYIDSSEGRIAIVNFAENEWASASKISAGANPMDTIDNFKQIKLAKKNATFVIVIVHGGHEYYNLPSPRMQKQYRFYAEQGADLVVGHHTHCLNGYEFYKGVPIYYSLGNFLFTKSSIKKDWYKGLVLSIKIKDKNLKTNLLPVGQEKGTHKLNFLVGDDLKTVQGRIEEYHKIIINEKELIRRWNIFINSQSSRYLNYWSLRSFVKNKYLKVVLNKLKVGNGTPTSSKLFLNLIRCEAHRDLSQAILKKYLKI